MKIPGMKVPGPDHPIMTRPTAHRVTVRAGHTVVADTNAALGMSEADYPVVQYIPLDDVEMSMLRPTATVTTCPYKGQARYYSIVTDDGELTDAVWEYAAPYDAVSQITGHVAFDPRQVQITTEPAAPET